ncbi:MAG: hypothetical protein ACPGR2_04555 [Psychrobium sp.]
MFSRQFLTFLIITTGFDLLALNLGFGAIRISLFLFAFVFFLLVLKKQISFNTVEFISFFLLIFSMFITSYFSSYMLRSIAYIVWFLLCYLLYFSVFRSLSCRMTESAINYAVRDAGRIQIILTALMFFMGVERPALLYYEPSYMAIALVPYIYLSLKGIQGKGVFKSLDVLLIFILLFVTKSANLILLLALSCAFIFFRFKLTSLVYSLIAVVSVYYFTIWYADNSDDLIAITFKNMHASTDLLITVIERMGNRWPRFLLGLEVASQYLYTGVGLGTFSDFSLTYMPQLDYSKGFEWLEPRGFPVTNVFLELVTEGGLFVLIFCIIFLNIVLLKPESFNSNHVIWRNLLVVMLFMLFVESSLLRPYVWAYLGIFSSFKVFNQKKNGKVSEENFS